MHTRSEQMTNDDPAQRKRTTFPILHLGWKPLLGLGLKFRFAIQLSQDQPPAVNTERNIAPAAESIPDVFLLQPKIHYPSSKYDQQNG